MRMLYALPVLLLGACKVSEGDNEVTVQFNRDVAENAAETVVNETESAAEAIANGAENLANRAENVDVDVDTNTQDNRN